MASTSWYAFHGYNNGQAIDASATDTAELDTLGFHGYLTKAQAEAKPNSVNIFQAPVVNAAIDDYNNARDLSPTQANNPANPAAPVQAAGSAAKNVIGSGWKLVFGNTNGLLGRILKVVIGGVLMLSGLLRITGAGKAALGVAGKAAVLA